MKIITLNTWGGAAGLDLLEDFFEKYNTIDIFCLQEIWNATKVTAKDEIVGAGSRNAYEHLSLIKKSLPNHEVYFHPHHGDCWGLATLVHKRITVVDEGEIFVFLEKGIKRTFDDFANTPKNIQYLKLEESGRKFTVINFHGLWNGRGKSDTEDRINQSKKILNFTKDLSEEFVLCGDFNLLPETRSLQMFEKAGLQNLIKDFGITSTRTSHYKKEVQYADYVFLTKGLKVKEFKVLPEEVSDHAALYLEIE